LAFFGEHMMTIYSDFDTPLGAMRLIAHGSSLSGAYFIGEKHFLTQTSLGKQLDNDPTLQLAQRELLGYFHTGQQQFTVTLAPQGTLFQQRVWETLREVPYGATVSYKTLAERLGQPSAVRAVAAAVGRNPLSIVIPCHRVIGSNGSLTGYAGGLHRKRALLALETDDNAGCWVQSEINSFRRLG
jgi:methylated-DNA-[protein]-cysteine S-methyltransferase